ncbi:hypothetical protein [Parasutterella excrementihominis]|uniref:hypothetical protein n=1 Tax=Parasutterella excrementihominis TaxID=487175 RepID=UPI003A90D47D
MNNTKDLQEVLIAILQGAKLRGETETAAKITQAIKMLEEDNAKKSRAFQEGAAKTSEVKRLKTQETVKAFKLSLPSQERNKPVTPALAVKYIIFYADYNARPGLAIDQRTAKRHLDKYWHVV